MRVAYTAMLVAEWPLGKLKPPACTSWSSASGRGRSTTCLIPWTSTCEAATDTTTISTPCQ